MMTLERGESLTTSSTLLNRYQRVVILFLLGVLVLLLVVISGMIIRQQSLLLDEALARRGAATLQHLSEVSQDTHGLQDQPTLEVIAQVALETDDDIRGITFFGPEGKLLASAGLSDKLPISPEDIRSVVNTRDYIEGKDRIFLSPIQNAAGHLLGLSLLRQSRFKATRMAISAASRLDAVIVLVFALVAGLMNFLLKRVKTLADQEAQKSQELAEAYSRLQKMQSQLMEAEKMSVLGRLSSSMAHELRNPLGAIKNAIYYIRDVLTPLPLMTEDPSIGEFLDLVDKEIKGATRIITDLLDFSRGVTVVRQSVDLNATLHHVRNGLEIPPSIQVVEEYAHDLTPMSLDADRMRQVFSNLCVNALQAMPKGGRLVLRSGQETGRRDKRDIAFVEIEDNGVGIASENLKSIFEPLFTTKAKGTGLGLPICRAIMKAHEGDLNVRIDGGRTVFRMELPLESRV